MHLQATTGQIPLALVFWFGCAAVVYTFAGYSVVVYLLARVRRRPAMNGADYLPTVTVVMAAHNEGKRISCRLQNILESDYPAEKLNVVVVSDGSVDDTVAVIRAGDTARVRVIDQVERKGKAHCLNIGVAGASGEIVVFADSRQRYAANTIKEMASRFKDPKVGAVSGELHIESSGSTTGGGVDVYWKLEKFIRSCEAQYDSCIGCTGAVYAIRRDLFEPLPDDTILDDVVIPMRIALRGFRVLFEPAAVAYDPQSLEPHREKIRKQRTLGGNFQMLFRYPGWLLPWNNRLWWQLISHKYCRLAAPFFLAITFAANAALLGQSWYRVLFLGQCLLYAFAFVGFLLPKLKLRIFSMPAGFVFLNLMTVRGFVYFLRQEHRGGWQTARN